MILWFNNVWELVVKLLVGYDIILFCFVNKDSVKNLFIYWVLNGYYNNFLK